MDFKGEKNFNRNMINANDVLSADDYDEIDSGIIDKAIDGRENVKQSQINVVCHRTL